MNNLKKMFAVVLTVAMIVTMFVTPAMAAGTDDVSVNAQTLESLKIVVGSGDGVTAEYLSTVPTREQAALLLLRLKGLEADAKAFTGTDNFTDVEIASSQWSTWGNILAYLKAHPEVGFQGIGGNEFGVGQPMDAKAYTKVLLVGLGYEYGVDFTWDTVFSTAAEVGLVSTFDMTSFTMNGLCDATVEALATKKKGEEITLASALAEAGAIDAETAEELGVITPAPTPTPVALGVESVTANNLIQMSVLFNIPVEKESAEDVDNYEMDDVTFTDAELLEDGVTVVLTMDEAQAQQAKVDLTVSDVKDVNELEIEETTVEDIEFIDMTIPTVLNAEIVGNDTFKVTFSEPMMGDEDINAGTDADTVNELDKNDFEVNGGKSYVKQVRLQSNNTEALVEMYSDFKAGDVTLKVKSGSEDFAEFGVISETFTLTVNEDEDAPVIIGYKDADTTGVTLIWNEDIEIKSATATNYYHTNSGNPIDQALTAADINGNEMTLDFGDSPMPEGTAYVYVLKEAVNDLWDNKNAQQMIAIEVEIDETAPAVEGDIDVKTQSQIVIEFTEELDEDSAEDKDNYTLLDSEGDEVKSIFDDITYASKKVTIDFEEDLSGDYSIVIEDVEDESDNKIAATTIEFTVEDMAKPDPADFTATLYNAGTEGQMVRISFGEKMATEGKYSVTDPEKYTIDGNSLADLDVDPEFKVVDDGKAIEIEIASDETTDGVDLAAGASKVVIARVADAAGNYMTALSYTFDLDASGTVGIDSVEATGINTVKVTFDDVIDLEEEDILITSNDGSDALAYANKYTITDIETTVDDGKTVATFTIDEDLDYDLGATDVYVFVVDEADNTDPRTIVSENQYGELLAATADGAGDQATDEIAPEVIDDDDDDTVNDYLTINDDDTFEIDFTEDMQATSLALAGLDFVVKADNETLVNGVDFIVSDITNEVITFSFLGDYLGFDGDIDVELAGTTNYVTDVNDNKPVAFTADEFEVAMLPTVITQLPAVTTFIADGTHTLVFSEPLDSASKTAVKAAVDAQLTQGGTATATTAWNSDGDTLTITIAGADNGGTNDVDLGAVVNQNVTDANGNAAVGLDVQL
jgi:hypothetical protein